MSVETPIADNLTSMSIDEAVAEMRKARETVAEEATTPPEPDQIADDGQPDPSTPDEDSADGDVFEGEPEDEDDEGEIEEDLTEEDEEDESESKSRSVADAVHRIRDGDEEIEVTTEELKNGYLRQRDYSKKTRALSEAREKIKAEATEVANDRQLYRERAEAYAALLERLGDPLDADIKQFEAVDWAKLKASDLAEYLLKRDEYQQVLERRRALQSETARLKAQQEEEAAKETARARQALGETLLSPEYFPQWQDQERRKADVSAMEKTALADGFSREELAQTLDPRVWKTLWKAAQYDKIKSRKSADRAEKGQDERVRKERPAEQGVRTIKPNASRPAPATASALREKRRAAVLGKGATFSGVDEAYEAFKSLNR